MEKKDFDWVTDLKWHRNGSGDCLLKTQGYAQLVRGCI